MLVSQFYNKNQFQIDLGEKIVLQSYESVVCVYDYRTRTLTLGRDWDYSNTTRKHVYMFMWEKAGIDLSQTSNKRQAVQRLIDDGEIIYDDFLEETLK